MYIILECHVLVPIKLKCCIKNNVFNVQLDAILRLGSFLAFSTQRRLTGIPNSMWSLKQDLPVLGWHNGYALVQTSQQ